MITYKEFKAKYFYDEGLNDNAAETDAKDNPDPPQGTVSKARKRKPKIKFHHGEDDGQQSLAAHQYNK